MDFLKKNWEKVLLGVVLVGLAVAVAFLPLKISSERDELRQKREIYEKPAAPLPAPDLSVAAAGLKRTTVPVTLDLSSGHRLVNPVLWQKSVDGSRVIKVTTGREVGPDAVVVVKTTPLYTTYTLDSVMTNADGSFRYVVGVERQAAEKPSDRPKKSMAVAKDTKAVLFSLVGERDVAAGRELELEPVDMPDERIRLTKAAPVKRVDGYLADLKYPPENRSWTTRRKGDKITFGTETYNIVAITANEVVLSAPSGKMSTVRTAESNR
jgi:hypothetical protein